MGWKPSTSLAGDRQKHLLASTCVGSGNCARMPSISIRWLGHDERQHFLGRNGIGRRVLSAEEAEQLAGLTLLRT